MNPTIIDSIAASIGAWNGKSILIVEDIDSNYQYLFATLNRSGAELIWVRKGEEAIELILSGRPVDLVLMDIQLEGIDGYSVTKELKRLRPQMPVIAQTAFAMKGEKEKSQAAGCDEYLSKPIRPAELLKTISPYL